MTTRKPGMRVRWAIGIVALGVAAAACSSSGSKGAQPTTASTATTVPSSIVGPTTTAPVAPITVLVTNDDGYNAPGIDTMVEALRKMSKVTVTVVAPMANQSGAGRKATSGVLTAKAEKTASGYAATAVVGYPADAVRYAFTTVLTTPPNLVVSGINNGQNVGPLISISGTVGAAEAAANLGVPAIAVSQGFGNPPDFAAAAQIVVAWITAHRSTYDGSASKQQDVVNINVPTCTSGAVRGVRQVPAAAAMSNRNVTKVDCASNAGPGVDDIGAFLNGFATITELDPNEKTVTATTTYNG